LSDIYEVLKAKLKDLKLRDDRIKAFEEELVRANKLSALGELAGSIAHEIQKPPYLHTGVCREDTEDRRQRKGRKIRKAY